MNVRVRVVIDGEKKYCDHAPYSEPADRCQTHCRTEMRRLKDVLPVDTKTKLYNAFVLPHLDYCCVLWYECSKELQHRVDRIQNYGTRLILSKPPGTPSEGLRQKLKWTHLSKRRNMFRLVLVHR